MLAIHVHACVSVAPCAVQCNKDSGADPGGFLGFLEASQTMTHAVMIMTSGRMLTCLEAD